ncbi:Rv3235 family protein [Actinomycetospora lutea]|uniref:Rv3235 family protein n=1 Tax=Actinomycetospora lutea TaxID=663604 RepID=UPI00236736B5|nr:Rv3235 family protein [Actinomycetospora lutea]MDD7940036.1 Rv3235 family protein [Actinomycetospora lutea]
MTAPATVPVTTPARARRVGAVPAPRVRPLDEVLAEPSPPTRPAPVLDPWRAQHELDRLAASLRPLAARLLTAVGDVLAGRRPARHLDTLLTPDALATLARAAPSPGTPGASGSPGRTRPGPAGAALRGLRVCAVGPRAAEVAAVVPGHERVRAVAARLERADDGPADPGRWRLVALWAG